MDELLEAQDQSYVFALKLNLPPRVVDDIHKTYLVPRDRLHQVLQKFTNRDKPRATWRIIINALNNPAVNLKRLAKILEAAHFPSSTSTHEAITPSTSSTPSFGSRETSSTPSSGEIFELLCQIKYTISLSYTFSCHTTSKQTNTARASQPQVIIWPNYQDNAADRYTLLPIGPTATE